MSNVIIRAQPRCHQQEAGSTAEIRGPRKWSGGKRTQNRAGEEQEQSPQAKTNDTTKRTGGKKGKGKGEKQQGGGPAGGHSNQECIINIQTTAVRIKKRGNKNNEVIGKHGE